MPVRPSFASTALYGSSTAAELESIENKLVGFLMKDESYKNQALCPTGPRLQINFNELVYHNKALAMRVCNEQGTSEYWLGGAARSTM
ncbi:hypothetical protein EJB05_57622 [Eragrostis curvula]|uniref:Uncharacterized protein n=1 Tax=Eragrostis curvula TaxID=38414 RepID=A0A5J9SCW7_9POAL|nr:hypothetical protein EJB05_57622 [Eragrostis curvula]